MLSTLFLLAGVLAPGQPQLPGPGREADTSLTVALTKAQELVYSGTFSEEATGGRVQFNRAFRVEVRLFVLDQNPRGAEVVVLTTLKHRMPGATGQTGVLGEEATTASVRLEKAFVDSFGR